MERSSTNKLRIGDWCVDPKSGEISRDGETARPEERTMRLLVCLAERAGEVVSIDDLLNKVWPEVTVTPDSVYQAVASLRRLLGDDPKQPAYIATVPRLGYRMVAAVAPWTDEPVWDRANESGAGAGTTLDFTPSPGDGRSSRMGARWLWVGGAAICIAIVAAIWLHGKAASSDRAASPVAVSKAQQPIGPAGSIGSIAVLPFLDLTEGMSNEEFADGMTEELIDRLSKIPGLRVPAPTASFFCKGKQVPIADIARALGVTYVLDGSVRKSGSMVRVAARLVRTENGYVIWTENYDRPFGDILKVQDDIAGEVTKALKASIEAKPERDGSR